MMMLRMIYVMILNYDDVYDVYGMVCVGVCGKGESVGI